ncbi:MAG TPA: hypothetical protein PKA31_02950 [Candidatus Moranbacteria bacterium]|mgnify:CR=1 FL=1|nr:hypothetical protein [Candidatus Moranbacteria bacterium]
MLAIPGKYSSLAYVRPIEWVEIFAAWKKGESCQKAWQQHWQQHGFESWEEWRTAYIAPLGAENLSWELFAITDPLRDIPSFYGVPSRGWISKAYANQATLELRALANLSVLSQNDKITAIKKSFPGKTMLTGIIHGGRIVIYEGMHRAGAIATWEKDRPLEAQISIALAEWKNPHIPIVGGNYKDGVKKS